MISVEAAQMLDLASRQMVAKFIAAEAKHKWKDYWKVTTETEWRKAFEEHVKKGDPRDVMIYCAIALARGWKTGFSF